jgi:hypothetical protein
MLKRFPLRRLAPFLVMVALLGIPVVSLLVIQGESGFRARTGVIGPNR